MLLKDTAIGTVVTTLMAETGSRGKYRGRTEATVPYNERDFPKLDCPSQLAFSDFKHR